jgi:hypothetical protein
MVLVWAARDIDQSTAWEQWTRMTLANHRAQYPRQWEGTISGSDCYNAPEAAEPGAVRTSLGMRAVPVNNNHAHSQPLLAYLRLLGIEPRADGGMNVGGVGVLETSTLKVDGRAGRISATGSVTVHHPGGRASGFGEVTW